MSIPRSSASGLKPSAPFDVNGREALRAALLAARAVLSRSADVAAAEQALNDHMIELLVALEPTCLGVYWGVRNEFSVQPMLRRLKQRQSEGLDLSLALPSANAGAAAPSMTYRLWDGDTPTAKDGCGIPTSDGKPVVPDVVVVPCVGYTRSGYRLGYGGGYFDRWLAANPHATAIGVAWSAACIDETGFLPEPHDIPLSVIVTERGVVA